MDFLGDSINLGILNLQELLQEEVWDILSGFNSTLHIHPFPSFPLNSVTFQTIF